MCYDHILLNYINNMFYYYIYLIFKKNNKKNIKKMHIKRCPGHSAICICNLLQNNLVQKKIKNKDNVIRTFQLHFLYVNANAYITYILFIVCIYYDTLYIYTYTLNTILNFHYYLQIHNSNNKNKNTAKCTNEPYINILCL